MFRCDLAITDEDETNASVCEHERCDGMFYDSRTNKSYLADSQLNAIHAITPWEEGKPVVFETIWANGDTDGADGLLDSPCEPLVIGDKLYISNFDSTDNTFVNMKHDAPHTLSVITLK